MRETFSLAAGSAEQAINANRFAEAQQQIALLATADPANYTVTILRSKLSAQRKLLDQQQDQIAPSQRLALETPDNEQLAAALAQQRASQLAVQPKMELPSPTVVLRVPPMPVAKPKPSLPTTTEPVLLQDVLPTYPAAALSGKQGGWVVVSFIVDVDGRTSGVQVVSSRPRRIFDRAATGAVRRYRFRPATRDGAPVASVHQQRIEFAQ